jgi:hypothetical protein
MNNDPFDDKQTREYYDRKVRRAEGIIPYIVLLAVVGFCGWFWVIMYEALTRFMQLKNDSIT